MELPVDVMALIDEITNIKAARQTEISVSVYVDETAPADLVAHVRGAFASTSPSVRMSITYLNDEFVPQPIDDIAVVVAGQRDVVGAAASALRVVGVPVMVVTTSPAAVAAHADELGKPIPEGDLVSPFEPGFADAPEEPYELDEEAAVALDERMGRWVVTVCRDKCLAFSIAFPFMRRALARDAVQATSLQNACIGLIPLIPGADLPIMTLNQAKMVLQIAAAYGHEMNKDRVKELVAVVGSAYLCRTLARELAEFVPFLGFAIRSGVAYGGTSALGFAVMEYFEGGEDATGVARVAERAAEVGGKFVAKVRDVAADPKSVVSIDKVGELVPAVREKAGAYVPALREKVGEYLPKVADTAADIMSKAVAK